MKRFQDKRVCVTGSGRGIGAGIARRFAEEGARVFLTARGVEELRRVKEELQQLSPDVRIAPMDLMDEGAAKALVSLVHEVWGGMDILVTNAGAAPQGGFLELPDEDWPLGFGLKLFANLRSSRKAGACLKLQGAISS